MKYLLGGNMATYRRYPNYGIDPQDPDYIPNLPSFDEWNEGYYEAVEEERKEDMTDEL